jgi:hypothetical protein
MQCDKADLVYSLRLRAQRWSPQRRAAEQRDEIASPHLCAPLSQGSHPTTPSSENPRCASQQILQPMSESGHSRRGRLLPVGGRLPLCPESGRKVMASTSVAMGQSRLLPVVGRLASASVAMGQKEDITQLRTAGRSRSLDPGLLGQRRSRLGRHPVMGRLLVGISELQ